MDTSIPIICCQALSLQDFARLAVVLLLLFASAVVSGSETAFFSLSPRQLQRLRGARDRSSRGVLRLMGMQEELLATILIANNFINICIVILSNAVIDSWLDFQGSLWVEFVIKTGVVTLLLLLFGEIMPKIFAAYNALRMARFMALPLLFLKGFFRPLSFLLIRSGGYINKRMETKRMNISMDELSNVIEITANQSVEEKRMLSGIADFVHTEVEEILRPRMDMVALSQEADFDEVKAVIMSSGFSRIPVYEESLDHIRGVLYVKDLIPHIAKERDFKWQSLCRKPYFVPEHKMINDLLEEFQSQKIHIAIVVDEYGSTLGLVSLEDILEEIVGEISDESDVVESFYVCLSPGVYLFDGKTHLSELTKVLSLEDNYFDLQKGEAETVAGLMLEIRKDFLRQGEELYCRELTLRAESLAGHRIEQVRVVMKHT